ncbi:unnamed protein product [Caretta caretta]
MEGEVGRGHTALPIMPCQECWGLSIADLLTKEGCHWPAVTMTLTRGSHINAKYRESLLPRIESLILRRRTVSGDPHDIIMYVLKQKNGYNHFLASEEGPLWPRKETKEITL